MSTAPTLAQQALARYHSKWVAHKDADTFDAGFLRGFTTPRNPPVGLDHTQFEWNGMDCRLSVEDGAVGSWGLAYEGLTLEQAWIDGVDIAPHLSETAVEEIEVAAINEFRSVRRAA